MPDWLANNRAGVKHLASSLFSVAVSAAIIFGAWYAVLGLAGLDPYFAKDPDDIWRHLVTSPDAAQHRVALVEPMLTTLRDAFIGFFVGTAGAIICAALFLIWAPLRRTLLPILLATQSVPMVAMTPLIVLVFGRGLGGVTVITGLVTFFPTLVNLTAAMQAQEAALMDVFRVFNASSSAVVRKLLLPSATPALLASTRIAVPRALLGALLVEWLATGQGLGYFMVVSATTAQYERLWSAVVLLAATSYAIYAGVSALERHLLTHYGWRQPERRA